MTDLHQLRFRYRVTDAFGNVYEVIDAEVVNGGGFFGRCLRGRYRVWGGEVWDVGDFRLDRCEIQLELQTATATVGQKDQALDAVNGPSANSGGATTSGKSVASPGAEVAIRSEAHLPEVSDSK